MAILKNNPFGSITGKIGDDVLRIVNGKSIISKRPSHYNTKSLVAKANRNLFREKSKFGKIVYSVDTLKSLWKYLHRSKSHPFKDVYSAYQLILKYNSIKPQNFFQIFIVS